MDKHTLTTIVITAVISATIKELVGWWIRHNARLAAAARAAVNQHWSVLDMVLTGALALAQFAFALVIAVTRPATSGLDVFSVALLTGAGFWYLRELESKLAAGRK